MSIASHPRARLRRAAWAALALFAACAAQAQQAAAPGWTASRPIRLVVPYPAGGGTDIAARMVAGGIAGSLGQPMVVENKPGANGVIAADYVYESAPDAGTLLFGSADVVSISPHTYPNIKFKPDGFSAVAPIAKIGVVLAGRPGLPARTVAELVAGARERQYTYAHWGPGSNGRIGMEIFQSQSGVQKMLDVPYLGTAPALLALLAGQVDLMLVPTPLVIANRAKLQVYGVASPQRYAGLKDVPTLAEQGYPVDADIWFGVLAPPGTPQPAIEAMRREFGRVVNDPAVQARMIEQGLQPDSAGAAGFADFVKAENHRWGAVIQSAGIRIGG